MGNDGAMMDHNRPIGEQSRLVKMTRVEKLSLQPRQHISSVDLGVSKLERSNSPISRELA